MIRILFISFLLISNASGSIDSTENNNSIINLNQDSTTAESGELKITKEIFNRYSYRFFYYEDLELSNRSNTENFYKNEILNLKILYGSELSYFNNSDLKNSNNKNIYTSRESEDNFYFFLHYLILSPELIANNKIKIKLSTILKKYSGNDKNIQPNHQKKNLPTLYNFSELYLLYKFVDKDTIKGNLILGRYFFSPDDQNLFFPKKNDGILFLLDFHQNGFITLYLLNVMKQSMNPSLAPEYIKNDLESEENKIYANGDATRFASGFQYKINKSYNIKNSKFQIEMKPGFIFTHMGGAGNGSDRSQQGNTGSRTDNDYYTLTILDNKIVFNPATIYLNIAMSRGIDRKLPEFQGHSKDKLINGHAFKSGFNFLLVPLNTHFSLQSETSFFYSNHGNIFNYGFTSLEKINSGGFLLSQCWNYSPSPYLTGDNIENRREYRNHSSGTMILHNNLSFFLKPGILINIENWHLWNSPENSNYADIKNNFYKINKKQYFGSEFNLSFFIISPNKLTLYQAWGIFLPDKNIMFHKDPLYGFTAGAIFNY